MMKTIILNQEQQEETIKQWEELLIWLEKNITNGYHAFTKVEDLQAIVDTITHWYEFKYPNRTIDINYGIKDPQFEGFEDISKNMTLKQLMYRFSHEGLLLMKCKHRASGIGIMRMENKKGEIENNIQVVTIKLPKEEDPIINIIHARRDDGMVCNFDIEYYFKFIKKKNITINELYEILREKPELKLDTTELESVINDHLIDLELRKKILQLTALNILYSKNTNLKYGYERAKRFIEEFNEYIPDLNLSTTEIEEIRNNEFKYPNIKIKIMCNSK